MLATALSLGLLWQTIVPLTIQPGMTSKQVDALLRPTLRGQLPSGGLSGEVMWLNYPGITVHYVRGKVESVERHSK